MIHTQILNTKHFCLLYFLILLSINCTRKGSSSKNMNLNVSIGNTVIINIVHERRFEEACLSFDMVKNDGNEMIKTCDYLLDSFDQNLERVLKDSQFIILYSHGNITNAEKKINLMFQIAKRNIQNFKTKLHRNIDIIDPSERDIIKSYYVRKMSLYKFEHTWFINFDIAIFKDNVEKLFAVSVVDFFDPLRSGEERYFDPIMTSTIDDFNFKQRKEIQLRVMTQNNDYDNVLSNFLKGIEISEYILLLHR